MNSLLQNRQKTNTSGFTIVELLIVIVIIAILAAITIVAYNGIQQRANNITLVSLANSYSKLLKLYVVGEDAYPMSSSVCLGENSDTNSDGVGDCGVNAQYSQSSAVNSLLSKYGTLPSQLSVKTVSDGTNTFRGVSVFWNGTTRLVDGASNPLLIKYYLQGTNQDCSVGNVLRDNGDNTWSTGTGQKYTYTTSSTTTCYVAIK